METQQHQEIGTTELGMNPKPTHVCLTGAVNTAVGFLRACDLFPLLVAVSGTGGREVSAFRRLILLELLLFVCVNELVCVSVSVHGEKRAVGLGFHSEAIHLDL